MCTCALSRRVFFFSPSSSSSHHHCPLKAPAGKTPSSNLQLLKSISGWLSMNFFIKPILLSWSLVGFPAAFCRWSYIIFSTVDRVSPSKSAKLEFSGTTFFVSILGSPFITFSHQLIWLDFVSVNRTSRLSSNVQNESSGLILSHNLDFSGILNAGSDFKPNLNVVAVNSQTISFARVPTGTGKRTSTSCNVCDHT